MFARQPDYCYYCCQSIGSFKSVWPNTSAWKYHIYRLTEKYPIREEVSLLGFRRRRCLVENR
jgi:hypothetical protein